VSESQLVSESKAESMGAYVPYIPRAGAHVHGLGFIRIFFC
jgi:hypothetical protein